MVCVTPVGLSSQYSNAVEMWSKGIAMQMSMVDAWYDMARRFNPLLPAFTFAELSHAHETPLYSREPKLSVVPSVKKTAPKAAATTKTAVKKPAAPKLVTPKVSVEKAAAPAVKTPPPVKAEAPKAAAPAKTAAKKPATRKTTAAKAKVAEPAPATPKPAAKTAEPKAKTAAKRTSSTRRRRKAPAAPAQPFKE
ncbi:hypothetical protein [Actibacterium lipolyticum]|uniref:Uncharacterized protein n=1 Tax=Actibacterium lipolyticum TaxID=1524263 RepID=A0A238JX05_9RHOB|nr:hypothetical protein [Actibacterium lipolyticum]SMX34246.1 hypothetical protein COL8621_01227 [Actibacterium lipolyticum]